MPLGLIDPLGMQPCSSAALHKPGDSSTNASGDDNASFGPSDETSTAALEPDDCGNGWQTCMLDGAEIGCDLLGDFTGGGNSILAAYSCTWSDCLGAGDSLDEWGNPRKYFYLPPAKCSDGSAPNSFNCQFDVFAGYNGPQNAPGIGNQVLVYIAPQGPVNTQFGFGACQ